MITFATWAIPVLYLILGCWFGIVERVTLNGRRVALQAQIARRGRQAPWIDELGDTITPFAALKRAGTDVILVLFAIYHVAGLPGDETFTVVRIVIAVVIGLVVVGLVTTVLAAALARHVGPQLVARTLPMLRLLAVGARICRPIITFVDEIVRRLSGAPRDDDEAEQELLRSIEVSQREGALGATAAEMLENVVEFSETDVGEIMTPRTDIEGIELTNDLAEIRRCVIESGHSRIPVFEENLDHISGILYVKDLVRFLGEEANGFDLTSVLRQPIVVPETKPVQDLLADFQRSEVHMAIVIDEYGGTAGLVTIEDVLEEIVGEIRDEHDDAEPEEPMLLRLENGRIEVDGRYNLDDLNDELDLSLPEDEEYDTIAGFVLDHLGHVPREGETIEVDGLRLTALAASSTQIERLAIDFPHAEVKQG